VYPAAVKAVFRYGASKSTHRVEDVVSGRTTPTSRLLAPLVPAWVSALNWDIVGTMFTVKELMLTAGTVAELVADADGDEVDVVVELDEDEQPAPIRARAAARATQPSRGKRRSLPSPCEREPRPPSLLSPSVIALYPFRVKAPE
jgi:hypothetical protein